MLSSSLIRLQKYPLHFTGLSLILTLLFALSFSTVGSYTAQANVTDLFISEYIEGNSFHKALEIYNGTGADVNLADYQIELYSNGAASATSTLVLSGILADNDVFVVANPSADTSFPGIPLSVIDLESGTINHNGDDAFILRKISTNAVVDSFGQVGVDPGSEWVGGGQDDTLRRKLNICEGDTNPNNAFDASFEWDSFPENTFDGLGTHTVDCSPIVVDPAPVVESTTPEDGAQNVALDANITIAFSEDVITNTDSFDVTCTSGARTFNITGGPDSFVLDPDTDFGSADSCTVTVSAANIIAVQSSQNMAADFVFSFDAINTTPVITLVHDIQGENDQNLLDGQFVTIEGIVVGDFQNADADTTRNLEGFYVQEENADFDANPLTSEGIFVFEDNNNNPPTVDVNSGDLVRVTGTVDEAFGQTQLESITSVQVISSGNLALFTPTPVVLPSVGFTTNSDGDFIADLEAYEGMLVVFPQELTVTELFNLDRFGEIRVSQGGRLFQFTNDNAPSVAGYTAHLQNIATRSFIIDDGQNVQNPEPLPLPASIDLATDSFRMGDTLTNLTGVLGYGFNQYRVQPFNAEYSRQNPRPTEPPTVDGDLKIASFNVLNFFTTLDAGPSICGPQSNVDCRGANTEAEFDRQLEKLVTALAELDADIIGLIEIENNAAAAPAFDGTDPVLETLVDALNAKLNGGTYTFVDAGIVGGDAIKVAFIYDAATVTIAPGTTVEILDDSDLAGLGLSNLAPVFNGVNTSRTPLAVTFEQTSTGAAFTAVINHFKSKSGTGTGADADQLDGAGNWNQRRLNAAIALNAWVATDPTGSNDPDFLLMGDFNAYPQEDPITTLENTFVNLLDMFVGADAYSFVFDGQAGALDTGLVSSSLLSQVTGVGEWHVNADEPDLLDYNLDFGAALRQAVFRGDLPFRTADHDPLVIGLNLDEPVIPVVLNVTQDKNSISEGEAVTYTISSDVASDDALMLNITLEGTGINPIDGDDLASNASFPGVIQVPFTPGNDLQIVVTPDDDDIVEADETMTFSFEIINSPSNISVGTASVSTTVLNNDNFADVQVVSFTLFDSNTDQPVAGYNPITEGAEIDVTALPENVTIVANTNPSTVGSVKLQLTGPVNYIQTENSAPYALFGNLGNDYGGRNFPIGAYSINAVPYTLANLAGEQGQPLTVNFSIVQPSGGSSQVVQSFTLIDANTEQPVPGYEVIQDGAVIDAATLPNSLSIRANTNPSVVGSVAMQLSGSINENRTENIEPYALFGNHGSNGYFGRSFPVGVYTMTATPYTERRLNGQPGQPLTITFTINEPVNNTLIVESFTLINATTDQPIAGFNPIENGAVIDLAILGNSFNIRANVNNGDVESVVMNLSGPITTNRVENLAAYALFGNNGNDYAGRSLNVGAYTVSGTPYAGNNAAGEQGATKNVNFTVINSQGGTVMLLHEWLVPAPRDVASAQVFSRGMVYPSFSWRPGIDANEEASALTEWFNLTVVDADNSVVLSQWVNANTCADDLCVFTPDSSLLPYGLINGNYAWWVTGWANNSFSSLSDEAVVSVDAAAPVLPVVSADAASGVPVITWNADPNSAWYQVWVGQVGGDTVFQQWIPSTDAQCDTLSCTLTLRHGLTAGNYEVYIQSWGAGGFSRGGIEGWAGPALFTISGDAPALPTNLSTGINQAGYTTLSWDAVASATAFGVWVGTLDGVEIHTDEYPAQVPVCENGRCTVTLTMSLPEGDYIWYVQSRGAGGVSIEGVEGWVQGPVVSR